MNNIKCPHCGAGLQRGASRKTALCSLGHCFDFAKSGYLNLLTNKQKKSKAPGDDKDMVRARERFLGTGAYDSIVTRLSELIPADRDHITTYADIACGNGFYTHRISQQLSPHTAVLGVDISQPAILQASKAYSDVLWLVSNAFDLPIESSSQDLVTCLFARFDPSEIARILSAKGLLITATAGQDHLKEVKEALYLNAKEEKPDTGKPPLMECLDPINDIQHETRIRIKSAEDMYDLIHMTPHKWRSSPQKQKELVQATPMEVTIQVNLSCYQKCHD